MSEFTFTEVGQGEAHTTEKGKECVRITIEPTIFRSMDDVDLKKLYLFEDKAGGYKLFGLVPQATTASLNFSMMAADSFKDFAKNWSEIIEGIKEQYGKELAEKDERIKELEQQLNGRKE